MDEGLLTTIKSLLSSITLILSPVTGFSCLENAQELNFLLLVYNCYLDNMYHNLTTESGNWEKAKIKHKLQCANVSIELETKSEIKQVTCGLFCCW